jgi:hypothetical protein
VRGVLVRNVADPGASRRTGVMDHSADAARAAAAAARADAARAAAVAAHRATEEDLGAGESVSERVGKVFAGYSCSTMTVRYAVT